MALYLGSDKVKLHLCGVACLLNILTKPPVESSFFLASSDGFVLKDSIGLYLIPKIDNILLSLDNRILTDTNGSHLAFEEGN